MEFKISNELRSFRLLSNICGSDCSHFIVDPVFIRVFNAFNLEEKVDYFAKNIENGIKAAKTVTYL